MEENQTISNEERAQFPLPIFLYDSQCDLCLRFKQSLERLPGSKGMTMVSIHNDKIYQIYPELSFEQTNKEIHVLDENRIIHKGSDAISIIIQRFPMAKKFAWLIESNMGKKALKFFHDKADQFRETLLKQCKNCK